MPLQTLASKTRLHGLFDLNVVRCLLEGTASEMRAFGETVQDSISALKAEQWRRKPHGTQLLIAEPAVKKATVARERAEQNLREFQEQLSQAQRKV